MDAQEHARQVLYNQRGMMFCAMQTLMMHINNGVMTVDQARDYMRLHEDIEEVDRRLAMHINQVLPAINPSETLAAMQLAGPSTAVTAAPAHPHYARDHQTGEQYSWPVQNKGCYHPTEAERRALSAQFEENDKLKQMDVDYAHYREQFATTGDEEAFEKMLDCVYMT